MLPCALGHRLGRAPRVALGRCTLGCLRLRLFLDFLLLTLLMCILHVRQVALGHLPSGILRCCNMQRRYVLVKKCGALSFLLWTVMRVLRVVGVGAVSGAVTWVEMG